VHADLIIFSNNFSLQIYLWSIFKCWRGFLKIILSYKDVTGINYIIAWSIELQWPITFFKRHIKEEKDKRVFYNCKIFYN
jgi:hypothetical protein